MYFRFDRRNAPAEAPSVSMFGAAAGVPSVGNNDFNALRVLVLSGAAEVVEVSVLVDEDAEEEDDDEDEEDDEEDEEDEEDDDTAKDDEDDEDEVDGEDDVMSTENT